MAAAVGWTNNGTSCSSADSDPCWPGRPEITGSATVRVTAAEPRAATTTSPIRSTTCGPSGPNQPSRDGLLARHHPPGVAQHRLPGREHVSRRAGAGVDVPGAPVPADRGHVPAQVGMGVGVERAVDGHHAVVGGHQQQRVRRQRLGDERGEPVDLPQLQPPGQRAGAVLVAEPVEVAVVAVDELLPWPLQSGNHLRGEVAQRVHAAVHTAPQGRPGEAGPAERGAADRRHADARRRGLLQRGRVRLDVLGDEDGPQVAALRCVLAPVQDVEHVAADPHRGADEPVRTRREPGAERGEADDRARRKPDRQRPDVGEARQERRVGGVGAQELVAEPVDEQERHRPRARQGQGARGRGRTAERGDGGGQHLGERAAPVLGHDGTVHPSSLPRRTVRPRCPLRLLCPL